MIKEASIHFNFDMAFCCPHCGKENDCEPIEDHQFDPIYIKFKDWISNKKGADKIDIETRCESCERSVRLTSIIR